MLVLVQVGKRFHSLGTKLGIDKVLLVINIEIAIYQQHQRSEVTNLIVPVRWVGGSMHWTNIIEAMNSSCKSSGP